MDFYVICGQSKASILNSFKGVRDLLKPQKCLYFKILYKLRISYLIARPVENAIEKKHLPLPFTGIQISAL